MAILVLLDLAYFIALKTTTTITVDKKNNKLFVRRLNTVIYTFPYPLEKISRIELQSARKFYSKYGYYKLVIITADSKEILLKQHMPFFNDILQVGYSFYKLDEFGKNIANFLDVQYSQNLYNTSIEL